MTRHHHLFPALCMIFVVICSAVTDAVTMQDLCRRAEAMKQEEPKKFSCVIDMIYRDQLGEYTLYDISRADPRAVFKAMQLTTGHSFENLV